MLVGGLSGGVDALSLQAPVLQIVRGLWIGFFSREILVGLTDIDAVPPLGGILPS